MNYRELFRRPHAQGALLLAALIATTGAARLSGQDFERTFGQDNDETGRSVQQTADGGYIAAGYTEDPVTKGTRAYVVRMSPDGGSVWERRFTVGGATHTFGMDLKQLASGDHILVGTVETPVAGCVGCAHIYAIRFTDKGDLVWYKSYGDAISNQYATSVVETQIANPNHDDVGNLVIAGYSIDKNGEQKGVLMRLWENGEIRWTHEYDAQPGTINDNELMSVDETRAGANQGDIVATGYTSFAGNGYDVWVIRVDGITGNIIAAPQGSARFWTPSDDRGYSIQELRLGAHPGDLVIAGESFGRPGTFNSEILMLQTRRDPCDAAGQRGDGFLGDNRDQVNVGRCVREINSARLGTVGDVVVTGASATNVFGSFTLDLFLQQFREGSMAPAGSHNIYGGRRDEIGYGLGIVKAGITSAGFIVTGPTNSNPPAPAGHANDLYVVRTDQTMRSCTQTTVKTSPAPAALHVNCVSTQIDSPQWSVLCVASATAPEWGTFICQ